MKWVILHPEGDLRSYEDAQPPKHFSQYWAFPDGVEDVRDLKLIQTIDNFGVEQVSFEFDQDLKDARVAADQLKEQEDLQAQAIAAQRKKREFGNYLLDYIGALNEKKQLSIEASLSFLQDPIVVGIKDLLSAGAIETARQQIVDQDLSSYFSNEEKNAVVSLIEQFLAK